jgi:hypothetical protein
MHSFMDGEVELLGERIAEQAAHLDAATHRLLADLREFDARGGWHLQGARSCAHWLSWRVGWDLVTARDRVRVACRLGAFPATDDALRRGELSYSKVRAILRVATPANEATLLECARLSTAAQLEKLSRGYARVQAHGQEKRPRDDEQRRYVRRRDTEDGMVKIEAVLHPEEAELVWAMLDHAAKQLVHTRRPPLRGDASAESHVVLDTATSPGARHSELHAPSTEDSAEPHPAVRNPATDAALDLADASAESHVVADDATASNARHSYLANDSAEAPPPPSEVMAPSTSRRLAHLANDSAEAPPPPSEVMASASYLANDSAEAPLASSEVMASASSRRLAYLANDSAEAPPPRSEVTASASSRRLAYLANDSAEAPLAPSEVMASASYLANNSAEAPPPPSEVTASASSPAPIPVRPVSKLREAEDASKRAFNRADALLMVAQAYLRGDRPNRTPIDVMITIPLSDLRDGAADPADVGYMGGSCLAAETVRRLSCDAGVVEVVEDVHGVPLSVGRKRRTIAGSIKRAVLKRDTACVYPGCENRIFLEGHHVQHWADGGETSLANTCLLCTHHHRFVHEYGYRIELGEDGRPQFHDPRGRLVVPVPERPIAPDLGWPRIRAANEALAIDSETIACEWDGTPMRYGTVIGQLVTVDDLT